MKTRSRSVRSLAPVDLSPAVEGSIAPSPDLSSSIPEAPERISVPIRDGKFDLGSMRESTKDKLKAAIDRTAMGPGASAVTVPPVVVPAICHALSALATVALIRLTGASPDIVTPIAEFTPADQAILKDPLLQVLDKYLASSLDKYGAEAALLMALYAIGQQKIMLVRLAMTEKTKDAA